MQAAVAFLTSAVAGAAVTWALLTGIGAGGVRPEHHVRHHSWPVAAPSYHVGSRGALSRPNPLQHWPSVGRRVLRVAAAGGAEGPDHPGPDPEPLEALLLASVDPVESTPRAFEAQIGRAETAQRSQYQSILEGTRLLEEANRSLEDLNQRMYDALRANAKRRNATSVADPPREDPEPQ
eukprot:TRINITY_DN16908_c0_g1_i1.p1 TRINITY_DN16908_c0_g1~~TRINITY_DN16908_c0_g1_i1.p1  ORF type:complete len:202 (-),score=36.79 TRINITY_DN16908_c0_g1_i1:116-652(-)